MIWVGFRIDHAAVRPFAPPGLKLTADSVGFLGIYQAPTGYGLAPYTRGLMAVSLRGEDDPGVDGLFVVGNVLDEPAAGLVRHADSYVADVDEAENGGLEEIVLVTARGVRLNVNRADGFGPHEVPAFGEKPDTDAVLLLSANGLAPAGS